MDKTYLEVVGVYGNGWQDPETGVEYFNDRVVCTHGVLGKLKVEFEDGFPIIMQADELVLIRRGFPHKWTTSTAGAAICESPFGYTIFRLTGKNGRVEYQLLDDELAWKDAAPKPDLGPNRRIVDPVDTTLPLDKWQLGIRQYSKWEPMLDKPERYRNTTTTTVLQEAQ
jgi:hypothetical protein